MSNKIITQLFTEYEEPKEGAQGYYHIYADSVMEGVKTINIHDHYLCDLKISEQNKPLKTDFIMMENLKYGGGQSTNFIEKVCPQCRVILEERFPKIIK